MTGERISSPPSGSIVQYNPEKGKPYDVYIVSGDFEVRGRISNFWNWRKIKKDGTLVKKQESGYGRFTKSPNKYEIEITVKKK